MDDKCLPVGLELVAWIIEKNGTFFICHMNLEDKFESNLLLIVNESKDVD